MNNYVKAMIHRMARLTGTILSDRHFTILEYTYQYYEKNKVGPLYLNLKKHVGATKEELNSLFPHGLVSVYIWVGIPVKTPDKSCDPTVKVQVDNMRSVYMDYNATTFIRPEVARLLNKYISGKAGYANPSSSTIQGKRAYDLVNKARHTIARILAVNADEIIFTGTGSEANNLAVKGIAFKHLKKKGHIITSRLEHSSMLKSIQWLETIGFDVTWLDAGKEGVIQAAAVQKAFRPDTILVSIMAVNNEIGTINPLEEIGLVCRKKQVPFVVDAVQGFCKIELKPKEWGIAAMSFSGHKIYAPKGIGGLYLDHNLVLEPLVHGGGQEFGVRSGTENVGYIIALGEAAMLAARERQTESNRILDLRESFLQRLKQVEPDFVINGSLQKRIPWNLSIGFPGIDSGALLLSLNSIGICVSAGSACSAGKIKTSHVLDAIQADTNKYGTLRFSFGLKTAREDLDYLFKYLPDILQQLRTKPNVR